MPRRTGHDRRIRPLSKKRIKDIDRKLQSDKTSVVVDGVPRAERPKRPIDAWPIDRDVFKGLARTAFEDDNPQGTKPTRKIVESVAGAWATTNASGRAFEISRRWGPGDFRANIELVDWQFLYEIQDRRDTPLPDDAFAVTRTSIQTACQELGLDYATLNSIPERQRLPDYMNPF